MNKAQALDKIRKCLALAASDNPHEAATALRQAQALMRQHGLTSCEAMANVREADTAATVKRSPPLWESLLAQTVAETFGCVVLLSSGQDTASWRFIGSEPAPDISQYAMAVLLRQIKSGRKRFLEQECGRMRVAQRKTLRADAYCLGFVRGTRAQLAQLVTDPIHPAVHQHITEKYPALQEMKQRPAGIKGKRVSPPLKDFMSGLLDGRQAKIARAVDHARHAQLSLL